MIIAEVKVSGPLLTGDAMGLVDRFIVDATWVIGAQALADVHQILDAKIQNPTPFYETQLMEERQTPEIVWVHDRGIVYGPWLEGTGSRNRTTQFKGYKAMRTTAQQLGRDVPRILGPWVEQLYRQLGG
jgi:hypothetical protein